MSVHKPQPVLLLTEGLVDESLHAGFAEYDLFAITADLKTCRALKETLVEDLNRRQKYVDDGGYGKKKEVFRSVFSYLLFYTY